MIALAQADNYSKIIIDLSTTPLDESTASLILLSSTHLQICEPGSEHPEYTRAD